MCKIAFRNTFGMREPKDVYEDAALIKPGDPVVSVADDHEFTEAELQIAVIVSVPDMDMADGAMLCAHGAKDDTRRTLPVARSWNAPLDKLKPDMARAELLALLVNRPPIKHPEVV